MNLSRIIAIGLLAGAVAACSDDDGGSTGLEPLAGVRFVNALPDTVALDFRVIKPTITFAPQHLEVAFRQFSSHRPVSVGSHEVRAFFSGLDSRDEDDVQIVIANTTPTFAQGQNQSVIVMGFARAGQTPGQQVLVTDDTPPARAAGQYHIRAIHAGAGLPAMDIFIRGSGDVTPATPAIGDVAYGEVTPYIARPIEFSANVANDTLEVVAVPVGGGTALVAKLPIGSAGTIATEGAAGTRFAGGALTVLITPRSVAGSRAPQDAATATTPRFAVPELVVMSDRRTPRVEED
jgi:hypothetical protein